MLRRRMRRGVAKNAGRRRSALRTSNRDVVGCFRAVDHVLWLDGDMAKVTAKDRGEEGGVPQIDRGHDAEG